MKTKQIRNVVLHVINDSKYGSVSDKINELHVQVIASRLNKSNLTSEQKIIILDCIVANLKSNGVSDI